MTIVKIEQHFSNTEKEPLIVVKVNGETVVSQPSVFVPDALALSSAVEHVARKLGATVTVEER